MGILRRSSNVSVKPPILPAPLRAYPGHLIFRLAPCGEKRSPPGRAFDFGESVGQQ